MTTAGVIMSLVDDFFGRWTIGRETAAIVIFVMLGAAVFLAIGDLQRNAPPPDERD